MPASVWLFPCLALALLFSRHLEVHLLHSEQARENFLRKTPRIQIEERSGHVPKKVSVIRSRGSFSQRLEGCPSSGHLKKSRPPATNSDGNHSVAVDSCLAETQPSQARGLFLLSLWPAATSKTETGKPGAHQPHCGWKRYDIALER